MISPWTISFICFVVQCFLLYSEHEISYKFDISRTPWACKDHLPMRPSRSRRGSSQGAHRSTLGRRSVAVTCLVSPIVTIVTNSFTIYTDGPEYTWLELVTCFTQCLQMVVNNNKPEKRDRLKTFLWQSYDISGAAILLKSYHFVIKM